jgi:hypothetical protein
MSVATRRLDGLELTALLTGARINNETLGISGMLVYHDGSFLQILEGECDVVGALFDHIAKDDRHTSCVSLR